MSDLEQLQKNLNYQIKAQEIGLASWRGSHGTPQKMFIPNKDYLLNSASRQQDAIKKRNDMVEEYLEEQQTPVFRYDEFGDIIRDMQGNPIEYKFHGVAPPELDLSPFRLHIYNPIERGMIDRDISIDEQKNILENKDVIITGMTARMNENIRQYTEDLENMKQDIIEIDNAIETIKQQNEELYAIPKVSSKKKPKVKDNTSSIILQNKKSINILIRRKKK